MARYGKAALIVSTPAGCLAIVVLLFAASTLAELTVNPGFVLAAAVHLEPRIGGWLARLEVDHAKAAGQLAARYALAFRGLC
jgi:hypothetical protein